jgi:tetratricopeptide (TPR) repeat protein
MLLLLLSLAAASRAASSPYQLNAEAIELYKQARYREAEAGFRRTFEAWSHVAPAFAHDRALTAMNLGTVLRIQGRYAEAEPLLAGAFQQLETLAGHDSLDAARAESALAALYEAWNKPAEAEMLASDAYRIFSRDPSATGLDIANGLLLLSSLYMETNRDAAAEAILQELLKRGDNGPFIRAYNNLAVAAIRRNDFERAEALVLRALDMASRILPERHPLRAAALTNLAQICRFEQRYLEAERHYREAIEIWETSLGARNPDLAKGLLNLAALHHERGRERAAEELYRRAATIFHDAYGDEHELTLVARAELADVLRAERRYSESERLTVATLPSLQSRLGAADPRVIRAVENYRLLHETVRR